MQPSYELEQLIACQPTHFRRAGTRRERGVRGVNIYGHVQGTFHALMNFLENFRDPFFHDFVDRDGPRAKRSRISIIVLTAERTTDPDLHIFVFADQALIQRMTKWSSVTVWHGLKLSFPGIDMRVDVNQRDRAIFLCVCAQERKY